MDESINLQGVAKALTARIIRFKLGEIIEPNDAEIQFGRYYNQIVYLDSSPERTFVSLGTVKITVLENEITTTTGVVLPKKTVMIELAAEEGSFNQAVEAVLEALGQLKTLDKDHFPNYLKRFINK